MGRSRARKGPVRSEGLPGRSHAPQDRLHTAGSTTASRRRAGWATTWRLTASRPCRRPLPKPRSVSSSTTSLCTPQQTAPPQAAGGAVLRADSTSAREEAHGVGGSPQLSGAGQTPRAAFPSERMPQSPSPGKPLNGAHCAFGTIGREPSSTSEWRPMRLAVRSVWKSSRRWRLALQAPQRQARPLLLLQRPRTTTTKLGPALQMGMGPPGRLRRAVSTRPAPRPPLRTHSSSKRGRLDPRDKQGMTSQRLPHRP
mmetsp:Transcript_15263/g.45216  ORF Transcript_15263/g.45216 Transcript_15263/m.45216 type:complete len:255 (+) Transcript_15263:1920-2684(+)